MDRHKELQREAIEAKRYMQKLDEQHDKLGRCGELCVYMTGFFLTLLIFTGWIWLS